MKSSYELSEARQCQVDLAAIGAEIFAAGANALSEKRSQALMGKPIQCLRFYFERQCLGSQSENDPRIERLIFSVTDPNRIDEQDYSGKDADIFLFPTLSESLKNIIRRQVSIARGKKIGDGDGLAYYSVPACAVTASYEIRTSNNGLFVDTNTYQPPLPLITSGYQFAKSVIDYIDSDTYKRYPSVLPKFDEVCAAAEGGIVHVVKLNYTNRPPVSGHESLPWLKKYATWLRWSIGENTYGSKDPKSSEELNPIGDIAMDDGILLIQTLDAIKQLELQK